MPIPGQKSEDKVKMAEPAARPKQSVVTVSMRDGSVQKHTLDPLSLYKASKDGETGVVGLTYAAAWHAAGQPEGSLEAWLATTLYITEDIVEVPLASGKQR